MNGQRSQKNAVVVAGHLLALLSTTVVVADPLTKPECQQPAENEIATSASDVAAQEFIRQHCVDCHDDATRTADLSLEAALSGEFRRNAQTWEHVVRRLRARQMPPPDSPRPTPVDYQKAIAALETELDRLAAEQPNPGRTDSLRRLTRTEYGNAIRDLLSLEVDVDALLPVDDAAHGFDNATGGTVSPSLLTRYVSAAQFISRLAVGRSEASPSEHTIRIRPDRTQEEHVVGLPLGTRGGALVPFVFPRTGQYDIRIRLMRDRNEHVEGLTRPHELEVLVDRARVAEFTITPPRNDGEHHTADVHLVARVPVGAGPRQLGITFLKEPSSLLETRRQPYAAHFNMHRHPRITPAVYQISIVGPFDSGAPSDTPSRRQIFSCYPAAAEDEHDCAVRIVRSIMRRAYRRSITDDDLQGPLEFYDATGPQHGFEAGIEAALSAILVSPQFLFRIERDPADASPQTPYRISGFELASRLSFFLWSSIPDDELLVLAEQGELGCADVLERQVRRMLADKRAQALVTNFASQWLHLRNLDTASPDARLFADFDDNLRQAFREETELCLADIMGGDCSVLDLLRSDYTYLNERLAKHYGIAHVYGSRFRRVELDPASHRGGLLRQGSILTVTSYATRTSPVIRGHWILKNLLGLAPPPPPPNVPALDENFVSARLPIRQRLAQHRADATCARCHDVMDPVGFALENYDAVGRWREFDEGEPVDSEGSFPDGSLCDGVTGLEHKLLEQADLFVGTLAERLLTFALGRGVEYYDAPAIRQIVRRAREDDYRFSSLVMGVVDSIPFQMRRSP